MWQIVVVQSLASRIYDKIGDTAVGKVLYKMPRGILCELVKPVDEIKF